MHADVLYSHYTTHTKIVNTVRKSRTWKKHHLNESSEAFRLFRGPCRRKEFKAGMLGKNMHKKALVPWGK